MNCVIMFSYDLYRYVDVLIVLRDIILALLRVSARNVVVSICILSDLVFKLWSM